MKTYIALAFIPFPHSHIRHKQRIVLISARKHSAIFVVPWVSIWFPVITTSRATSPLSRYQDRPSFSLASRINPPPIWNGSQSVAILGSALVSGARAGRDQSGRW